MNQEERTLCRIRIGKSSIDIQVHLPGETQPEPWSPPDPEFDLEEVLEKLKAPPDKEVVDCQSYGGDLFECVFGNRDIYSTLAKCPGHCDAQVRIVLHENLPESRMLRWEYLWWESRNRLLAYERPFQLVRRLMGEGIYPQPGTKALGPLSKPPRVLVVVSNPDDLASPEELPEGMSFDPVENYPGEQTGLLETMFDGLGYDYELLQGAPSPDNIKEVLKKVEGRPDIIHFLAHGYVDNGMGYLVLTDGEGKAKPVSGADLKSLFPFRAPPVRLIILAACQSDAAGQWDEQPLGGELTGVADSLLRAGLGIPAIIAMQDEISKGAAGAFAKGFYEELAKWGYIDRAMAAARTAVRAWEAHEKPANEFKYEWGIPVLYLQNENSRLFDPGVQPNELARTMRLFKVGPEKRFVDRKEELDSYATILCETEKPCILRLLGPKWVGKRTLLKQFRHVAYTRGYGHLMVAETAETPRTGEEHSKILHSLLQDMFEDDHLPLRLGQVDDVKEMFAEFLEERTKDLNPHGIAVRFLDGLEALAESLERGIVCLFYFYDFEANRDFLAGPAFKELVKVVTERYDHDRLQKVRFIIAMEAPEAEGRGLLPKIDPEYYLEQATLRGLKGVGSIKQLCETWGLAKEDRVPAHVWELVEKQRSWKNDQEYLPGYPAEKLKLLAAKLDRRGLSLDELGLDWISLDGAEDGQWTSDLFRTTPVTPLINRESELSRYVNLLYETETPSICWLYGPKRVGKKTLLKQLRYLAYQRRYGHLMVAETSAGPLSGKTHSEILYDLLKAMLHDESLQWRLDRDPYLTRTFESSGFLREDTRGLGARGIVLRFLDGLEVIAGSLERGIVCFFYFFDFAANRDFLLGRAFNELGSEVIDRYHRKKLQKVRFIIATETPPDEDRIELFPVISLDARFDEFELRGLRGVGSIKQLCESYGLVKDDRVPKRVWEAVHIQQSWVKDQEYLPGLPAEALKRLALQLQRGASLDELGLNWISLGGVGGER